MKTKYTTGNTAFNDGLLLPSGMLSIDSEKKALRFHDGQSVGGYEVAGQQAVPILYGPGPQELIAGDMSAGFFGEVTSNTLLTYSDLSTTIGVSQGVLINDEESLWLKFALDDKILYVAKKPVRCRISWEHLNINGGVFGTQVSINNNQFTCRILKGASSNPTVLGPDGLWTGFDIDLTHDSEWNRLMYPIHSGAHTDGTHPSNHDDPNVLPFGSWNTYNDEELSIITNGASWCQETPGRSSFSSWRIYRGEIGISNLNTVSAGGVGVNQAWRPCLELIVL